jgi:hypothetical protein
MQKQSLSFLVACAVAFTLPAAAQYTGVSHPDEVPITTSPEGVMQPVVYAPAPARPAAPPHQAFAATAPTGGPAPVDPYARPAAPPPTYIASAPLPVSPNDAGVVVRVAGPSNVLPEGTIIKTRLLQSLSTSSTPEGAEWSAELLEPAMRDGQVLIPAGAILRGRVTEVRGGKRIHGKAAIHLRPISILMPDGNTLGMHAQVIDTSLYHTTQVDREGTILRRDHKKEDASILALTAGSGAAAGALVAGVPGALVGAAAGAGISTAIWLREDRQAVLPQNTQITFELDKSMVFNQQ